ncbi:MAG: hypothetical protein JWQ49_4997 [Edaphobacter sp.]|nr:hypothetical protein [Edaphobacter sp.]
MVNSNRCDFIRGAADDPLDLCAHGDVRLCSRSIRSRCHTLARLQSETTSFRAAGSREGRFATYPLSQIRVRVWTREQGRVLSSREGQDEQGVEAMRHGDSDTMQQHQIRQNTEST